jgi:sugar phosphate isomerase/epimerase
MYGKGNPVDAISIFGDKIRGVHVKDGDYPKGDFYALGNERVVGEGSVNFPVFIPKLLASGYKGDLYIEHEISDRNRFDDVKEVVKFLENFLN